MSVATAAEIASDVAMRRRSATDIVAAALGRIENGDKRLNAFNAVNAARAAAHAAAGRARAEAAAVAAAIAAGEPAGPLAGVPFAVKNLIDIAGLPTLAGSK